MDLRRVEKDRSGAGRWIGLVRELDRCDAGFDLELFVRDACFLERNGLGTHSRPVPASRLFWMDRPVLGHLRTAVWGKSEVMHFPTGECWAAPTCRTVVTLSDHLVPSESERGFSEQERLESAVRSADRVVTLSDEARKRLERIFPDAAGKMQTIHPGVDPEFHPEEWGVQDRRWFREKVGAKEGFVLYCHSRSRSGSLPFVLESFAAFREISDRKLNLLIAGDRRHNRIGESPLETVLRERGLSDDVRETGWISDGFLRRHYCAAGLFLFPSDRGDFAFPPLEAMSCGCPVIATSAGAMPEILGEGALLLPAGSPPEEWARAMVSLYTDLEKRKNLILAGMERASVFSWKETAARYRNVYFTLPGRRRTAGRG